MSIASLDFSLIFIHVRHRFYICKHNLQAAMDKENYGLIAVMCGYIKLLDFIT